MDTAQRKPEAMLSHSTETVTKGSHTADLSQAVWQRSSADSGRGPAVEVAFVGDLVAVREEPAPGGPVGPVLIFTPEEWDAFVGGAKDGEFDLD